MPFCSHEAISIYHEAHGEGFPLLLISGLSGGTWTWYGQVAQFGRRFKTITYDNRGAGQSSMPPGPYTMRQLAEDALCVLDAWHTEESFVVGISMGGMIAQELALLAPDRVRALLLGCTHCGGKVKISPSQAAMEVLMNNDGLSQRQILEKNLPFFLSSDFIHSHPQAVREYIEAQLSVPLQPEHAFMAQLAAIHAFDLSDQIHQIRVPTLIVNGTKDILVPLQNARLLAERIPHSTVTELAGAGHAIHVERRELFNELVLDFFREHSP